MEPNLATGFGSEGNGLGSGTSNQLNFHANDMPKLYFHFQLIIFHPLFLNRNLVQSVMSGMRLFYYSFCPLESNVNVTLQRRHLGAHFPQIRVNDSNKLG